MGLQSMNYSVASSTLKKLLVSVYKIEFMLSVIFELMTKADV